MAVVYSDGNIFQAYLGQPEMFFGLFWVCVFLDKQSKLVKLTLSLTVSSICLGIIDIAVSRPPFDGGKWARASLLHLRVHSLKCLVITDS